MRDTGAAEILRVWEAGCGEPQIQRALTMLTLVCPETSRDDLASLPLGRRDQLLLEARRNTLGDPLNAIAECPECAETVEFQLSSDELLQPHGEPRTHPPPNSDGRSEGGGRRETKDEGPEWGEGELSVGSYELRFRLIDSHDLLAISRCETAERARDRLIERCVLEARRDGRSIAPTELPAEIVEAVAERMSAWDPCAETLIDLTCPNCSASWRCELDVVSFFWQELRGRALRLLDEVAILAREYGWTENEILALGPVRRSGYLERIH